jgi:formylglycine-generating enzyme
MLMRGSMLTNTTGGMAQVVSGTFLMGSDRHYPEEAPVHRVTVAWFWIDRTPVTNRQLRKFVTAFAEIAPDPRDYPGALPHMLKAGSLIFRRPSHTVDLRNWSSWWTFEFGANWRRPYGRKSTNRGLDDLAHRLSGRPSLRRLGAQGAADGSGVGIRRMRGPRWRRVRMG